MAVGGRKQLLNLVNEQLTACMQQRDREERERGTVMHVWCRL